MGRYKKLGTNMGWMLIGNFGSKLLNFFLIPLYTNCLTTQEYGEADLIFTTINLIIPILTLSIGEAVLRFSLDKYALNDDLQCRSIISLGIYFSCISILFLLALNPVFSLFEVFQRHYILFILYFSVEVFYVVLAQYAKGTENVFAFSLWGVVCTFFTALFNIVFILVLQMGIKGYLLAFILGQLVTDIGLWFHLKIYKQLIGIKSIDKSLLKSMLLYSIPLIPNTICWWISNSSDRYMVTWLAGSSENGIYAIAAKFPSMIAVVFNMFIMAWQISAVEDFGTEESRKFYSSINKNYISLCLAMASGVIALTKPLASIMFGKDFFVAWKIAPVLIVACCFHSLGLFLGTIYTSAMKTKSVLYTTIISAIINLILNFYLIREYGAFGAAIATLVSYAILWLYRAFDSRRIMKLEYNYLTSIASLLLLMLETIIICADIKGSLVISLIIFAVVLVLNRSLIKNMVKIGKPYIAKVLHK